MKPPGPPAGPPRADAAPSKAVVLSAQTATRPPWPIRRASARMVEAAVTATVSALDTAGGRRAPARHRPPRPPPPPPRPPGAPRGAPRHPPPPAGGAAAPPAAPPGGGGRPAAEGGPGPPAVDAQAPAVPGAAVGRSHGRGRV